MCIYVCVYVSVCGNPHSSNVVLSDTEIQVLVYSDKLHLPLFAVVGVLLYGQLIICKVDNT